MRVEVRLFAVARQLTNCDAVAIDVPDQATIGQLRAALADQYPALGEILAGVLFSIGTEYATDQTVIPEDAEIACIPPVSGG